MQISYPRKFIFVHVPKTGGMSVLNVLKHEMSPMFKMGHHRWEWLKRGYLRDALGKQAPLISHHETLCEIKSRLPRGIFDSFYKFAFVRNPWDWQVSMYTYILQDVNQPRHQLIKQMSGFEEYIKWKVVNAPKSQLGILRGEDGKIGVDFVGRFENLEEDFAAVAQKIGMKVNLPHVNQSKRNKDYRVYYNDETRELIEQHYREEIDFFGYKFE